MPNRISKVIQRRIDQDIQYYAAHPQEIPARLAELDQEWDIGRTIEARAATITLAGVALGLTVSKRWLTLPLVAGSFLLQYALLGWCPPLPLLRRMGVRTSEEINRERRALNDLHTYLVSRAKSRKPFIQRSQ